MAVANLSRSSYISEDTFGVSMGRVSALFYAICFLMFVGIIIFLFYCNIVVVNQGRSNSRTSGTSRNKKKRRKNLCWKNKRKVGGECIYFRRDRVLMKFGTENLRVRGFINLASSRIKGLPDVPTDMGFPRFFQVILCNSVPSTQRKAWHFQLRSEKKWVCFRDSTSEMPWKSHTQWHKILYWNSLKR